MDSRVAIVILNWNGKNDTLDCIKSICKLDLKNISLTVVIVDNASTDGSVPEFYKLKSKKYSYAIIQNSKNLGFAGGNNTGLEFAIKNKFDYILLLNNDTRLDPKLLVNLIETSKTSDKWGLISPKIYFEKGYEFHRDRYKKSERGKVFWAAGGEIDWRNVFGVNRGVDLVDKGQYKKQEKIDFATGACVLLNPKALKKVGLFDEKYFLYFEDLDLCLRMRKKKFEIIYSPASVIWHKVSQSSGIGSDLNDYFITRNRLLFGMKYAPLRTKIALVKQSLMMLVTGRNWQKQGVVDFLNNNFEKGSWKN